METNPLLLAMDGAVFIALLKNAAMLFALAAACDLLAGRAVGARRFFKPVLSGVVVGTLAIALISAAFVLSPGIVFDTRSVLLSVSGLYFGVVPTFIGMAMAAVFRVFQGGEAMWMGVAVVFSSGLIGLLWRRATHGKAIDLPGWNAYLFGVVVHLAMLASAFILPMETARRVLANIGVPVLAIYPLLTVALCSLLADRLRRLRTAEALSESESTYRNLFQNGHAVMLLIDPETGAIADANPAAVRFYGWPREQLVGMNIAQINTLPPGQLMEALRQAESARRNRFRFRHRLADGSLRDVDVASGPITIAGQRRLYSIIYDSTEREQEAARRQRMLDDAERSRRALLGVVEDLTLAEVEMRRLSAAIEHSPEAVIVTDSEGAIQYVNPAFERITGYSAAEAHGRNPRILKSGRQDAAFYDRLWQTISSGKTWEGRFANKRKDGGIYFEEASISPVPDPRGAITGYVAVKRDITGELAREEQLRQSQKMQAVGQLAGGVAHDFNNILQSILGFCGILLAELEKDAAPYRDVVEIRNAARSAGELTRQLLAFSREQPAAYGLVDLNELVVRNERMMRRLIGENFLYVTQLDPSIKPVRGDGAQIEQVLINLVVNARDAMPSGGRLVVATAPAGPGGEGFEDGAVCLSVEDSGCGIGPDAKEHMFEPFFTTKNPGRGTGLGLSVVYGIVQRHGGRIEVESAVGKGSVFKVFLPVGHGREPAAGAGGRFIAGQEDSPAGFGESVLVVEDDPHVRDIGARMLAGAGYRVQTAETAAEAMGFLEKGQARFDLLVFDVVLPDGNGIELAEAFRRQCPAPSIILCSGYNQDAAVLAAIRQKGFRYLEKPFGVFSLLQTAREMLDSSGAES